MANAGIVTKERSPAKRAPGHYFRLINVADEALIELVDDMREGHYPAGTSLPSLQELAMALGISVTNVRAAIQRLEAAGVVTVRRGRGGGVTVVSLDNLSVALSSIFERVDEAELPALIEAWATLERDVFVLVAERGDESDLARLAVAVHDLHHERTSEPAALQEQTFRVHTVAATIAQNAFLKHYFSTLMNMLGAEFSARGNLAQITNERRSIVLAQYDKLLRSVQARDEIAIEAVVRERAALQFDMMGLRDSRRA